MVFHASLKLSLKTKVNETKKKKKERAGKDVKGIKKLKIFKEKAKLLLFYLDQVSHY